MAGINLTLSLSSKEIHKLDFKIESTPHLTTNTIWDNKAFYLSLFAYENYPHQEYTYEDYKVFVEGKVYNYSGDELKEELSNLVELLRNDSVVKEKIAEILLKLDGDFIIVIMDELHRKIHVLNDLYSRLPMYVASNDDCLIISRSQQYIIESLNLNDIDRYAVAEFLLFNCTVSNRTLIEGIKYFEPASLFTYNCTKKSYRLENIYTFNFEKNIKDFNKSEYKFLVQQLKNDFERAVHDRSKHNNVVLGLSGGLDSRAVAAVFPKLESKKLCVSRLNKNNREKRDVELAKEVSEVLNLKHDIVKLDNSFDHLKEELLYLKSGLNDLDNLHNLNFEIKVYELYGNNFIYFSGCGGEIFKPFVPIKKTKNSEALIKAMIDDKTSMSLGDIAKFTKTDAHKLLDNLINEIEGFPELSPQYKYLHFLMYKNLFRYDFEGEDRKRNFFWPATPFLSHNFFCKALSVPDKYRSLHRFTIDVMNALDKRITDIPNRNWNLKPNDWRVPMHLWIRDQVSTKTKVKVSSFLKRLKGKQNNNIDIKKELMECDLFFVNHESVKPDFKPALLDTILTFDRFLNKHKV